MAAVANIVPFVSYDLCQKADHVLVAYVSYDLCQTINSESLAI